MRRQILSGTQLPGLLYLPDSYEEGGSWPLIVFLHGSGERGSDVDQIEAYALPYFIQHGLALAALVYAPQCPKEQRWFHVEADFFKDLDHIVQSQRVNAAQVYLTGFSMGGQGTWYFAARQPGRFAAIVPVAGRIPPQDDFMSHLPPLARLPTWILHSAADEAVEIENADQMHQSLQAHGAENQSYTRYEDADHVETASRAYNGPELCDWLLYWSRSE